VFQKILFVVFTLFSLISAQISFPLGSEVVDVTKEPYFAKGDGKSNIECTINDKNYSLKIPDNPMVQPNVNITRWNLSIHT